jgi:hypothetical protein
MTLRAKDLHDMVKPVFEIDNFQSKMGEDENIVVVSFNVNEQQAAKDLVDFIEKGYGFVLDADATPGEIDNNMYKVFVEMERNGKVGQNITELLDGVGKLADIDTFRFRYHKSFRSRIADTATLEEIVPFSADAYAETMLEISENYDRFFEKTAVEKIEIFEDNILIKKAFADPIGFKIKNYGPTLTMLENLEKINVQDYPELLFLTKYLGDYNVTKYGDKTLTLENNGYTLVVERL